MEIGLVVVEQGDTAQLEECLPTMHRPLGSVLDTAYTGYDGDPSTGEVEAGGLQVLLNLDYMPLCLKLEETKKEVMSLTILWLVLQY